MLSDKDYANMLRELPVAVKLVQSRRDDIKKLNDRKRDIHNKLYNFVAENIDPSKIGKFQNTWDPGVDKYTYTINFRIPSGEVRTINDQYTTAYKMPIRGDIGFFFRVRWDRTTVRIKDYSNMFDNKDTGPNSIFMYMDYAEELIHKAQERMKLSKYRAKYDLEPLIDTLRTLMELRGDKYYLRSSKPPKKYSSSTVVNAVTGKRNKQRGKAKLNIPFKISSVIVKGEGER